MRAVWYEPEEWSDQLSNMWPWAKPEGCGWMRMGDDLCIVYDGIQYPSVEHAYQAAKTLVKAERELVLAKIRSSDAKSVGRRLTLRSDWDSVRYGIMKQLVRQKFMDHDLKAILLTTAGLRIVEHGPDPWGDSHNGTGRNWMGEILESIREEVILNGVPH